MRTRVLGGYAVPFREWRGNLTMPLEQLCELWFRVKRFEASWEIYSLPAGTVGRGTVTFDNLYNDSPFVSPQGPVRESDIALFYEFPASGTGISIDWRPSLGDPTHGEYHPQITVQLSSPDGDLVYSGDDTPSAFTGTIDGVPIAFSDYNAVPVGGSLTITPVDWWPYQTSRFRRAIWNQFTGAQLLDPHQTDELPSGA